MINMFTSYRDLCAEIEWIESQIEILNVEKEEWWIGGRLFDKVPMDNAAGRVDRINDEINRMERILRAKKKHKIQSDNIFARLEGLEYKIAYKRYVEGKPLKDIAEELSFSYDHIRRTHSKMKKENATFVQQIS